MGWDERPPRSWGRLGVLAAGAILWTLAVVQFSLQYGRLAFPPQYDDSSYFVDALQRLDVLSRPDGGTLAALSHYWNAPPHAPGATVTAMAAFALMGRHEWAPYVLNALPLLAWLALLASVARYFGARWGALVALGFLASPLAFWGVHEFRPDYPAAVAMAWAVWHLARALQDAGPAHAGLRRAALGGVCAGIAVLAKPMAMPATLVIAGVALAAATAAQVRSLWDRQVWARATQAGGAAVGACALVIAPHMIVAGGQIWSYIVENMLGASAATWKAQAGDESGVLYYLSGPSARMMLGPWVWAVLPAVVVAGVLAVRGRMRGPGGSAAVAAGVVTATLGGWLIATAAPVKQQFFGLPFFLLGSLCLAGVVGWIAGAVDHWRRGAGSAAVGALVLLGIVTWRPWAHWTTPDQSAAAEAREAVTSIARIIDAADASASAPVTLTFSGMVNMTNITLARLREGRPIVIPNTNSYRSIDVLARQVSRSSVVITTDADSRIATRYLPSYALLDDINRRLTADPRFELRETIAMPTLGGTISVYVRRPSADVARR